MEETTTWRRKIQTEMALAGEAWKDVVYCTLSGEELDTKFDSGFGGSKGKPFTLWTKERVYFPVVYDGAEWASSVARNPDGKPTKHCGGE